MNIVDQLLKGSEVLHRMQADISQVINMLKNRLKREFDILEFSSSEGQVHWVIDGRRDGLHLECGVSCGGVYNMDTIHNIRATDIELIYHGLPEFVGDVFKEFPSVRNALLPLIVAAENN